MAGPDTGLHAITMAESSDRPAKLQPSRRSSSASRASSVRSCILTVKMAAEHDDLFAESEIAPWYRAQDVVFLGALVAEPAFEL